MGKVLEHEGPNLQSPAFEEKLNGYTSLFFLFCFLFFILALRKQIQGLPRANKLTNQSSQQPMVSAREPASVNKVESGGRRRSTSNSDHTYMNRLNCACICAHTHQHICIHTYVCVYIYLPILTLIYQYWNERHIQTEMKSPR